MAGFFDSYFNPATYGGQTGGLLSHLPEWLAQNMGQQAPQPAAGTPGPMDAMAYAPQAQIAPAASVAPQQVQPSFLDRLGGGLNNNSNMLLGMGAQLLGGGGWGGGLQGAMVGGQLDTKQRTVNQTKQALISRGVDPKLVDALVANPAALGEYLKQSIGISGQTDDIKEFEYAKRQGFTGSLEQWMQRKRAGAGEFGLQPIYGTDAQGNPVVLQLGKSGEAVKSKVPEGVNISTGVEKVDLGTQWGLLDKRSGQFVGYMPKDIAGKEAAEERGKATGQAQIMLPETIAKADQSLKLIDEMIAHPGRETATGLSSRIDPRNYIAGTEAADFQARAAQLKGRTFLEAYQSLKGGGAITEVEGKKAEEAIARLSTSQSDSEYVKSLQELRGIIQGGMTRARLKAGAATPAAPQQSTGDGGVKRRTYNPATGQLE